ncbi:MAG: copper chaperone PCu(A)C [Dechloromonas sp.]|nr:copper chaperone PCu(A)C [Dechloromonas sp.]
MKKLAFFVLTLSLSAAALAGAADQVSVDQPYVRLAPPNAPATGAFMRLRNSSEQDVKLLKASNPASRVTELHTHLNDNGVMKMRPVANIEIKAKGEAVLQPGGLHVMLIDLKTPLKEGDIVPVTLSFDDGSEKTVDAPVMRSMAGGMPKMQHGH